MNRSKNSDLRVVTEGSVCVHLYTFERISKKKKKNFQVKLNVLKRLETLI